MPSPSTLAFGVVNIPHNIPAGARIGNVETDGARILVSFELDDGSQVVVSFAAEQCNLPGVGESGRAAA